MKQSDTIRILGATLGDPYSASIYSSVPYHLFAELEAMGILADRLNVDLRHRIDLIRGLIDFSRSIKAQRPVRNAYWRFLPENVKLQTRRLQLLRDSFAEHNTVLQIGVGGLPADKGILMAAHAEISVQSAATLEIFSKSYGFAERRDKFLSQAIEGELQFLSQCSVIWTNTKWTAETFAHHGLPKEKFWIHAPACNTSDPGEVHREPNKPPHILFVGKDWGRKGGPLLLEAFLILKKKFPNAMLTIMGCTPDVKEENVHVTGFLEKKNALDCRRIDQIFRDATVFCMPSYWESVGLVYMEAALYGLPVIMLKGQGRDEVFPESMALHLDSPKAEVLAAALVNLQENPDRSYNMGKKGRQHVLKTICGQWSLAGLLNV